MKLFVIILILLLTFSAVSCDFMPDATYAYAIPSFRNCIKDVQVPREEDPRIIFNKYDEFADSEITVNNSDFAVSDEYFAKITDHINSGKQSCGFYAIDINTQMSFGYNAKADFFSASTVKAGYALYCFKEIAKGNADFNDLVKYEAKHFIAGSGSTQNSVYGTIFTVKVLLYRMLYDSDNIAYYMLIDKFGLDGYNDMITELGCSNTVTKYNRWGHLTPFDLGLIWQEIYFFKDTCEEGEILWQYLTGNLFNDIKKELSQYRTIAHKSGWNNDVCHDSGVVISDTPYIVVVMSGNKSDHQYIQTIIRYIDDIMKDYNQSSK